MGVTKRIVCLANSRKLQGRCVAGKELVNGTPGVWIRPVSARPSEEVSEEERRYENGQDPRVLDVIDVPLLEPRPKDYQQENWLLDPQFYWVKIGEVAWRDLPGYLDTARTLWINGISSYNGQNDRIPLEQAQTLESSLKLIHVNDLHLRVFKPGEAFGNPKRRVQGRFSWNGTCYRLWVTDPAVERNYLAMEDGEYMVGEAYLTISLGEPYEGCSYKLIATVILRP
jgi:hypothetical protein